jgi:hypothetical protein
MMTAADVAGHLGDAMLELTARRRSSARMVGARPEPRSTGDQKLRGPFFLKRFPPDLLIKSTGLEACPTQRT